MSLVNQQKGIPFPQIEADISAKLLKKQLSLKRFKQSLKPFQAWP